MKTQRFLRTYKLCPRMPNGDTTWRHEWGPNTEGPSGPLKEPGLIAAEEESSGGLGRAVWPALSLRKLPLAAQDRSKETQGGDTKLGSGCHSS